MEISTIVAKIIAEQPAAKLIERGMLEVWASSIKDGTHTSYTEPPEDLLPANDGQDNLELDGLDPLGEDDDFGDIVTVKGTEFVVCSGLVVPQILLHDEVLPLINQKMKELGVTSDDIFNALMTE